MSHITSIETEIKSLEALRRAAADCGLEFREGQRTYRWYGRWYGRWVGDTPLPKGMKMEDCGRCEHALHVAGNDAAYEIGLARIQNDAGEDVWQLRYDYFNAGYGLMPKVGGNACEKLMQRYGYHQAKMTAEEQGWAVSEETLKDGTIRLTIETQAAEQQYEGVGSW